MAINTANQLAVHAFFRRSASATPRSIAIGLVLASSLVVGPALAQEKTTPPATEAKADAPTASEELKRAFRLVEVKANTKKNLKTAIKLYYTHLDDAGLTKAQRVKGLVDLSRAHLRIGDLQRSTDAKIAQYEKGRAAAQKARAIAPKHADAVFWDMANMALVGQTRGITNSLFMLGDLKAGLRTTLKLDPSHNYARETLGRIYHAVPGILGGSDSEALALFQSCIKRDPNFTPCKVTLARFYIDNGDDDKARVMLNQVVNAKKSSVPNDFRKFNLPDAKRDLAKLK